MTRIDFHFNVHTPALYVCRLIRKAYNQGLKPVVYSPDEALLTQLDELLWTFSESDFIPHAMTGHPDLQSNPVVLTTRAEDIHSYDVLVNLSSECPAFFARFERLIEIVSLDEKDKQTARNRFKFYKDRGYPVVTYDQQQTNRSERKVHYG